MNTMKERDMKQVNARQRVANGFANAFRYIFLIVMALIVLFPFYWMINSSLKSIEEYRESIPTFWPRVVMYSNYVTAFTTAKLGRLFLNTLFVGTVSTLLSLVITILSAFAFARISSASVFARIMTEPNCADRRSYSAAFSRSVS